MADELNNTSVEEETSEQEEKTYTLEEVNKLLQSESDKRVNQALAKQKKEYEKKLSLSKLDDNEREKAEQQNRIAELEEQLASFQMERNKSELKSVLSSRGLSAEFADLIAINDNLEESQQRIDNLDKLFKAAVKAEVEKRISATGGNPKGNSSNNTEQITKESAKKLSLAQMNKLAEEQPELFKKLFG